jgi:hypothetical protein
LTNENTEKKPEASSETKVHNVENIPESVYWNTYAIGGAVAILGCILVIVKRRK